MIWFVVVKFCNSFRISRQVTLLEITYNNLPL